MRLALSGSSGKMGTAIQNLVTKDNSISLAAGFCNKPSKDFETNDLQTWNPAEIDVVVDFSLPESFERVFEWCVVNKKPIVSGTTGFDVNKYKSFGIPLLYSRNFSLGVASLKKALESFSSFNDAKVWIDDIHHDQKVDQPSGTAIALSETLKSAGFTDVQIDSKRAGSVFGVHSVHIVTEEEWLTLTHQALNREVFARGALKAASWLFKKEAGFYSMENLLRR